MYPLEKRVAATLKTLGLRPVVPEEGAAYLNKVGLMDPQGHTWTPEGTVAISVGRRALANCNSAATGAIRRYDVLPSLYRPGSDNTLTRAADNFPITPVPTICPTRQTGLYGT